MKLYLNLAILVIIFILKGSLTASEETLAVVHARVEVVKRAPPPPDTRDKIDLLEGVPAPIGSNVWIAELRVERVFSGDASLVGQFMSKSTMDEMPPGNSQPIVPLLKKGDEGIFAIKRFSDGDIGSPAYGLPTLPEGQLPLIKGRDAGYEKAMQRLMGAVHDNEPKSTPSTIPETEPTAPPDRVVIPRAPQTAPPAFEPATSPRWMIGGFILLALGVLYLMIRSKRA